MAVDAMSRKILFWPSNLDSWLVVAVIRWLWAGQPAWSKPSFTVDWDNDTFLLDGEPFLYETKREKHLGKLILAFGKL